MDLTYANALHRLRASALGSLTVRYFPDESDPHQTSSSIYADEQLALAARALVDAVNALHVSEQPVGWVCGEVQQLPARGDGPLPVFGGQCRLRPGHDGEHDWERDGAADRRWAELADDPDRVTEWLAAHGMNGELAPSPPDILRAVAADLTGRS